MSTSSGDSVFPEQKPRLTGVKAALQYTGIPPSWLDKRPKLPSRNWLIFIGVTSTLTGYYLYDRQQCKRIRQEYVDKVKHFAEIPLHSMDYPRKVTVYGTKWPGDEDSDRSMLFFRKYVKPVLVAAAVDYEMIKGKRHGDLARRIAEDIKKRRRIELGLEPPPVMPVVLPNTSAEDKRRRELEGGVVIVGRLTFKEFMAGLKRGWTEGLQTVDREEELAKEFELDGRFDEPEPDVDPIQSSPDLDGEPIPTPSRLPPSKSFSAFTPPHLRGSSSSALPTSGSSIPAGMDTPPTAIPPQPPILFVHFVNHIGLTHIPLMIWEFFNERRKVREGAEAAYRLIMGHVRPFVSPPSEGASESFDADPTTSPPRPHMSEPSISDLDFGKDAEVWYKKSTVRSFRSDIEKARSGYYASLPAKLETARALARRTRELTKEEVNYPPPTEVELRSERMKKELRWRADEEGWDIVSPDSPVAWDQRFADALRVFTDPVAELQAIGEDQRDGDSKSAQ
ncbi:hypothetical protein POSPLADRAFT_1065302 [Postia placenta MAD-698-R-SB12]|uniref:Mitochondrial import inner membrane translocase subunit TIM54 n=1 Tax=Postia placenta MAD-698-R-SB12 TaxID=670580 RepID=A0A1X6NB50_9APHY|nr:hypothetical protein POSPLADRAFT_1065302 [Postia placenta MAD-698-R-SB12]OSX65593.1 hypothetical protein POSPLADRAFT_1065302 [Postia placenta MAD-698-R-SB12]